MLLTKSLLFALLSLCCLYTKAQKAWFQTYTIQDGLVDNRIRTIYQDKNGFIWIGTWEGISRYDGYKFTNFSTANGLSHDLVNDITEYGDHIYVALNDGSVNYIQNNQIVRVEKFPTPFNKFVRFSHNKIIIPTDENGFYEFHNGKFQKPIQENPALNNQFLVSLNDSLLLSADENGNITVLTNNYKQLANISVGKATSLINQIYKDSHNRIWLCTDGGLFLLYYNSTNNIISLQPPPQKLIPKDLANISCFSIFESEEGEFWIGNQKGLFNLSETGHYKVFTENEGLPSSKILTIYSDREKNIWLGTTKGVAKFVTQHQIQNITSTFKLRPGTVGSVSEVEGGKFIINSSSDNPKLYDPATNLIKEIPINGIASPLSYFAGSDPWVFYNTEGFYQYDTFHKKESLLLKRKITPNFFGVIDKHGNSFIGLENKIGILAGKKIWIKDMVPGYRITALTADPKGYLWVGTWANGLYRIKYSFTNDSVDFKIRNFSHLVPDSAIRSLFTDRKGNIWVGTRYKGAIKLSQQSVDIYIPHIIDKKSGLYSNSITAFAEAVNGDMWLGSFQGLDKLIKKKSGYSVFNFSRINNVLGTVTQIIPAGKNNWWCIIEHNLVKFTDHFLEQIIPLNTVITNIRLGKPSDNINVFNTDTTISLKYSQNIAQFTFSAPGFINEKQILYSYRLQGGNDPMWSEPGNIHEVYYASLQPGNYIFEVRTVGWNKEYGKAANFSFEVLRPFWQKWWFLLLCFLLVIGILYALYRYRLKQIIKIQTVRNRIATDLHDDIGSNLTNIAILAELSNKNLNDQPQAAKYLQRIAEEINNSGQSLDDIIWNINSRHDSLDEMIIRMRRYAAELFDHTTTECQLTLKPGIVSIKIGMELRRDLYLLYKETLNNIYKHAAAQHIEVVLNHNKKWINLYIKDDGVGFDTIKESQRNGIKNLKKRVAQWDGKILINSQKGEGTTITIELPVS